MKPFILSESYVDLDYDDMDPVQLLTLYGMLMRSKAECLSRRYSMLPNNKWAGLAEDSGAEAYAVYCTLMNKLRPMSDMLYYVSRTDEIRRDFDAGLEDPY